MAATQLKAGQADLPDDRSTGRSWLRRVGAALMLPREHGAWAILLMPYLVGTAAACGWSWASLLLLVSLVTVFSSSRPLELALRSKGDSQEIRERRKQALARLAVYLSIAGLAGLLLLVGYHRWVLVGIGVLAGSALALVALLRRQRLDRTRPARLLSIVALSAAGPAAYYAATGMLGRHAFAVWLLASLYSGASLFYVRLFYRSVARQKPAEEGGGRKRAERQLMAYVGYALLLVVVLSALGWLPGPAALTLVPLAAKSVRAVGRREWQPSLKQIGQMELMHSALFGVLAAAAVALWG